MTLTTRTQALNKKMATYLLKTVWKDAPDEAIIKAALICTQYGLNPLMRSIYLIPFENRKTGIKEWAVVLGIKATRQIALQHHKYSYVDGPRVMTEKEQEAILGKPEPDKFWAITVIQDDAGNKFPGYGSWDKDNKAYGEDKGNSPRNMAFIRSERNALDKMAPGELPDIDVAEDTYIDVKIDKAVAEGKVEFQHKVEAEIDELWGKEEQKIPQSEAELLEWVALAKGYGNHQTARDYLVKVLNIPPEKIHDNPGYVFIQVKDKVK